MFDFLKLTSVDFQLQLECELFFVSLNRSFSPSSSSTSSFCVRIIVISIIIILDSRPVCWYEKNIEMGEIYLLVFTQSTESKVKRRLTEKNE